MFNKRRFRLVAMLLVVFTTGFLLWGSSFWQRIYDNSPDGSPSQFEGNKMVTNILILGLDQRYNERARADTIMVMSINKETDEVALVSIPRDSRVYIPGSRGLDSSGLDKINHATAYGSTHSEGIQLMKKTVENLLEVPIHYYVETNFDGFVSIVDTLGGVDIKVERYLYHKSNTNPINIPPGEHRMTGEQALGFVRFRGDREGDFGRMRRQQIFLKALAAETLQAKTLFKLPRLLDQVSDQVRTDMSPTQLLSFARRASSMDMDEVTAVTLAGSTATINRVSYVIIDEEKKEETVDLYLRWKTPSEQSAGDSFSAKD